MSNKMSMTGDSLIVEPQGIDKMLTFKNKLVIPFEHIMGATIDKEIINTPKGFRGPGTGLPNKTAGTWTLHKEKTFWNVGKHETPVVIQLKNEYFSKLVLGLTNPKELVNKINNLIE